MFAVVAASPLVASATAAETEAHISFGFAGVPTSVLCCRLTTILPMVAGAEPPFFTVT